MQIVKRKKLITAALIASAVGGSVTSASAQMDLQASALDVAARDVIVLVDSLKVGDARYSAEDIVATFASAAPNTQLSTALGNPLRSRFSIADRLPRAYRDKLDPRDPEELLQRFVVLTFSTPATASAAVPQIKQLPGVSWAGTSSVGKWHVVPNDTYYAYQFAAQDYQWGTNNPLHFQEAWDKVSGTAYVGHLDNGIQLGHPELDNTAAPWTTAFRSQLSKDFVATSQYSYLYTNYNGVDEALYAGTWAGHGSHTAGIIAATGNNATGVAGGCWNCSLIVTKMIGDPTLFQNALYWAVRAGAQILNYSGSIVPAPNGDCANDPNHPACLALEFARGRDVVVVASSGNQHVGTIDFPASDSRAIAVGGIQYHGYDVIDTLWVEENPDPGQDVVGTNFGPQQAFVAPARDVLSTVYTGRDWNPFARCGDSQSFATHHGVEYGGSAGAGYGICTGTSMAAPYVTAVAALVRSVNPLWTKSQVFEYIRAAASRASSPDQNWGNGVPNAGASVNNALAATNRLTPLFALYSATGGDYMYTTVPQAGISAVRGLLPPRVNDTLIPYITIGTTINEYPSFPILYPGPNELPPKAQVWIFTTPTVQVGGANYVLFPLYRMSYKCGDAGNPQSCVQNPIHVDHTYATTTGEVQQFLSIGYKLDGIEGYIYSTRGSPPSGTVALYRGYNGANYSDDWAIYPATELANMSLLGFRTDLPWTGLIGYAYLNTGSRPTY